jgi:hypothetical protein
MVYNHRNITPKQGVQDGDDMLGNNRCKPVRKCSCSQCIEQPSGEIALLHASINRLVAVLNEKHRRQFAGLLASHFGYGGIQYLSKITGLTRQTIRRGKREIERADEVLDRRIRAPGGGRHKVEKKSRAC